MKDFCNYRSKQQLYTKVKTRGPQAYRNLVEALNESGNLRAARLLDPSNQVDMTGHCPGPGDVKWRRDS